MFDNGNLNINGTDIKYFYDSNESYSRLIGYYMATMNPEDDTRDYYFHFLADLSKVNSYPQLPVPAGVNKYSEWLDSNTPLPNGASSPSRPACISCSAQSSLSGTVGPAYLPTDIVVSNSPYFTEMNYLYNPSVTINDYDKPGLKNIFFYKGFAISNDLTALSASAYPDLSIYDGVTINPNSSSGQPYTRIGVRRWLTSSSEYPDINGIMQTTTNYAPYSWKDFLVRLKAWAEHPTWNQNSGTYKFPFEIYYSGNLGKHQVRITRYKGLFLGINLDMNPTEVYNHFQRMLRVFGGHASPQTTHTPEPIDIPQYILSSPYFGVLGSTTGLSTTNNNVVLGAPFETSYFDSGAHYIYAQGGNSTLPSGFDSQGFKISKIDKLYGCGGASMHNKGIDNCNGCEWGCYYDWKTQQKMCSNTANRAFPFRSSSDCENFRLLNPDYLCETYSPINTNTAINTNVLTGVVIPAVDDPVITNKPYDCDSPCLQMPLLNPIFGTSLCGIKHFYFDPTAQTLSLTICATGNTATKSIYGPLGLVAAGWAASSNPIGGAFVLGTITTHGKWTATVECTHTTGISYWDICLEVDVPAYGTLAAGNYIPPTYKQVPCVNGRNPCCPNPPCQTDEDIGDAEQVAPPGYHYMPDGSLMLDSQMPSTSQDNNLGSGESMSGYDM